MGGRVRLRVRVRLRAWAGAPVRVRAGVCEYHIFPTIVKH